MKRIISIALVLILLLSIHTVCFADIDLSGMSFEELVALKDQINLAIWNSQEWQEVEVPQGVWEVGADIPAGKWTIHAVDGAFVNIAVGNETTNGGTKVKPKTNEQINSETYKFYDSKTDVTEWTIELEEGQFVSISYGSAIFTPYAGKPSLGFK